jgi:hypothetical protein
MKDNITALPVRPTTDDEYLRASLLMERIGGGFAGRIGGAYICADSHNKERLKAAFPDLFTRYYAMHLSQKNWIGTT